MVKQVIVIRKDLNMRKGKMVAQGAHASMKVFFDRMKYSDDPLTSWMMFTDDMVEWMNGAFTKICVGVKNEEELLGIYKKAQSLGIVSALIQDAGHTEFGGVPTYTAVAIGPAKAEDVDLVTGQNGPYGRLELL